MLKFIDQFLDRITMYRVVLYILLALLVVATVLAFAGILHYSPWGIMYTSVILVIISVLANKTFSWWFNVPPNVESSYITALILALIISPPNGDQFISIIPFLILASVTAMASKYVINIGKKHLFNPAAIAVLLTALILGKYASWWIGTQSMLIFTAVFGLMMVRKLRQLDLLLAFLLTAVLGTIALTLGHTDPLTAVWKSFVSSPLVFFGTIMLTEPISIPPNRMLRIAYGALAGILIIPQLKLGTWSLTPEIALVVVNLFSYTISPKGRFVFTLKKIQSAAEGAFDFVFKVDRSFSFAPGQYMEWTIDSKKNDSRGNRRYFTIASSPTEKDVILGIKFYQQPSAFKKTLRALQPGKSLVGAQLAGDFTLPSNHQQKLAFIAGGIGVTPFRSMTKYLIDKQQKRDIVVYYSNRSVKEIAYRDIFAEASEKLGTQVVYTITGDAPEHWNGYTGFISEEMIRKESPDFKERLFYISGSHVFVVAMKQVLLNLGVSRSRIKTDFFPGLA